MPPLAFLLRKKKKQNYWTAIDYGMAEAIYVIDNEKCRKCGTEVWLGSNDDSEIGFELDEHNCYACAFLEQEADRKTDKEPKKFGVTEFVKPVHTDSELKDIDPADIPPLDWKYRYQFYHGHKPDK